MWSYTPTPLRPHGVLINLTREQFLVLLIRSSHFKGLIPQNGMQRN